MAKKQTSQAVQSTISGSKGFNFGAISGIITDLSKKSTIHIEDINKPKKYISTGVYIINALLSKSIYGGMSANRITAFCGPKQTGKSFIALNVCREAQKQGYNIMYIDTESAIEFSDFEMYGIDASDSKKFLLLKTSVVENIKVFLAQVLEELKKQKEAGNDVSKTLIILDSLANLGSKKEIKDAIAGDNKGDMTKAKEITSMFRIITSDLGYLGIPMFITNHIYVDISSFIPQEKMKGGEALNYAASTIVYLGAAQLKTGEEDAMDLASGSIITAKSRKNRVAKPKKIKFEIDWNTGINPFKGLEMFCTPENFEKVGVAKVKVETDKTGKETVKAYNRWYVKHLNKHVSENQLFNGRVFTKAVLDALEPIISEYFRYASYEEYQKIIGEMNEVCNEFENSDEIGTDELDENTLFDLESK